MASNGPNAPQQWRVEAAEYAMSPDAFLRDWPLPALKADGVWHWGPAGTPFGFGSALTQEAADRKHNEIRLGSIKRSARLVWC